MTRGILDIVVGENKNIKDDPTTTRYVMWADLGLTTSRQFSFLFRRY